MEETTYKNGNGGIYMEFLKKVLGEELYAQVKTRIDAHNGAEENKNNLIKVANLAAGEYVGKGKYEALEADLNSKNAELTSANSLIEEMKAATAGNIELQNKITGYETTIAELNKELQNTKLENEVKVALLEAKATDIDYLTYKMKANNQEIRLDDSGKVAGIEGLIEGLKTQFPNQFESTSNKVVHENKLNQEEESSGALTKSELLKKSYAERNALFNENPDAYREIMDNE